jgi:branched-subunit amino acid ABC-type transport system permease component
MRETWAVRAIFIGFGALIVLGSYFVLIPDMAPNERSWVARAYPFVALAGLVGGLLALAIERRRPSLFARVTPATLAIPSMDSWAC